MKQVPLGANDNETYYKFLHILKCFPPVIHYLLPPDRQLNPECTRSPCTHYPNMFKITFLGQLRHAKF